ncbi:Transmembrane protein [Fasciolopsis buskii]|uniref:Transmembrane protein n=1 Tax=Fasciolopsis buskii TaxID=27845 RepID=A0A8E0RW64_9TREM|nr:Transmembrane protein [Fasciolopsis buski]
MDKFVAGQGGIGHNWSGRRFIVTESWILVSRFTSFTVIKQSSEGMVAILASSISVLDPDSLTEGGRPAGENLGTQMVVAVRFVDVNTGVCLLTCSLPASNLDALRAKLRCPLIKARGVDLEPTVVQRFVQAFTDVVDEGDPVILDSDIDLEQCIGCMGQTADVTLIRRCASSDPFTGDSSISVNQNEPSCGTCRCRPMWCLECMARWSIVILMGAEQSNTMDDPDGSPSSSVKKVMDRNTLEPTGSSSLPPSPRHFSPPFSGVLSRESSKSVTVPTVKGSNVSGPSLPPPTCAEATSSMNWFRSDSATRLSRSGHRSPSLSKLNRSSGVVVVCSGPMRRMRSTGSLDSAVYSSSRTDASSLELKRLRQIPTFEPLIARSAANRGSSHSVISPESSSSRRVDVSLPRVAPEELVALVKSYGQYVQRCADTAYQQQTVAIGLQNKVDYESRRVSILLQARESGTVPASPIALRPTVVSNGSTVGGNCSSPTKPPDITYAGHQQVDAVVLQTSQISGLIDQCTAMIEGLRDAISQQNTILQLDTFEFQVFIN